MRSPHRNLTGSPRDTRKPRRRLKGAHKPARGQGATGNGRERHPGIRPSPHPTNPERVQQAEASVAGRPMTVQPLQGCASGGNRVPRVAHRESLIRALTLGWFVRTRWVPWQLRSICRALIRLRLQRSGGVAVRACRSAREGLGERPASFEVSIQRNEGEIRQDNARHVPSVNAYGA